MSLPRAAVLRGSAWIARLGRLPLLHQFGAGWRYNTGASVAGVLLERVPGASIADVLRTRVFESLGMADTGFYVPGDKIHRFTTFYAPDLETGELVVLDRPEGWWSTPPKMPDAAGGLVSTVDDVWKVASILAADGGDLLSAESVRLMTLDRMTASERAENSMFVGDHSGWGLMMAVPAGDGSTGVPGGFGWDGGSGTTWRTDRAAGLTGILLTQWMVTSPLPSQIVTDFWCTSYAVIDRRDSQGRRDPYPAIAMSVAHANAGITSSPKRRIMAAMAVKSPREA